MYQVPLKEEPPPGLMTWVGVFVAAVVGVVVESVMDGPDAEAVWCLISSCLVSSYLCLQLIVFRKRNPLMLFTS